MLTCIWLYKDNNEALKPRENDILMYDNVLPVLADSLSVFIYSRRQ